MNFTLHHFKKEAAHIRWRWLAWLLLLGLDLAVQLEWLAPMPQPADSLVEAAHQAVLFFALLLAFSSCSEDQPSGPCPFIATRPLPRTSYFLARALVILALLVLPLAAQEALYLTLSHRPWGAVLEGTAWRGALAVGTLIWVVPVAALWKGWRQTLLATALLMLGIWICGMVQACLSLPDASLPLPVQPSESPAFCGCLMALLLAFLARLHLRHEWPLRRRLTVATLLAPVLLLASAAEDSFKQSLQAAANGRVAGLNAGTSLTVPQAKLRQLLLRNNHPAITFYDYVEITGLPSEIDMVPRVAGVRATQAGRALTAQTPSNDRDRGKSWHLPFQCRPFAHFLPPATIIVPPNDNGSVAGDPQEVELGTVEDVARDASPLSLECRFDCDWIEWQKVADLPLQVSARASTPDAELVITGAFDNSRWSRMRYAANARGSVEVDFHFSRSSGDGGLYLLLYSPERQLAWCLGPPPVTRDNRATDSAWKRSLSEIGEDGVLIRADGTPAARFDKLRLIVLHRRYLGRTERTWKSQPMDMRIPVPGHREWAFAGGISPQGDRTASLARRLDSLMAPGPQASPQELNGYVLDILAAWEALKSGGNAMKKQQDLVMAKLRPVAEQHLDLLLSLPPSAVPDDNSPVIPLVTELSTETQRDFIVSRMLDCDWLATVVQAKGWSDVAREKLLPVLLARGRVERHTRMLMLSWKDPQVMKHQAEELRYFPDAKLFETLYHDSSLRPVLDAGADALWQRLVPASGWEGATFEPLKIAMKQGRPEALELALRWISEAAGLHSGQAEREEQHLNEALAEATGTPAVEKGGPVPPAKFRGIHASSFDYDPARRAWRRKP